MSTNDQFFSPTFAKSLEDYRRTPCFQYVKFMLSRATSTGHLREMYRYGPYTSADSLPMLMSECSEKKDSALLEETKGTLSRYHSYYHADTSFEEIKFCYLLEFASEDEKLNRLRKRIAEKRESFIRSLPSDAFIPEDIWTPRSRPPLDAFSSTLQQSNVNDSATLGSLEISAHTELSNAPRRTIQGSAISFQ